jgi:Acetyltransferases
MAHYAGDDLATTAHLGAFLGERLVGIASLFAREDGTLQLRGMAVDSELQGTGVGAALVRYAEQVGAQRGYPGLWCNARLHAVGFYARLGWEVEGHQFEVPNVGPHFVMRRALARQVPE